MRYFFGVLLFLFATFNQDFAQSTIAPPGIPEIAGDSAGVIPEFQDYIKTQKPLGKMPVLCPPAEAGILRWWPRDDAHYFMPNMLSSGKNDFLVKGERLKGQTLKGDDIKPFKNPDAKRFQK